MLGRPVLGCKWWAWHASIAETLTTWDSCWISHTKQPSPHHARLIYLPRDIIISAVCTQSVESQCMIMTCKSPCSFRY